MKKVLLVFVVLVFSLVFAENLVIFHAGSLSYPMLQISKSFEASHPTIKILSQSGGSRTMARYITDLGKYCDIMISADYKVIDQLLVPDFAKWNILFATNQIVICYTDNSKYADKINSDNWYKILSKKDVNYGYSDPNNDPCGYRSNIVLQLSEKYYKIDGLYSELYSNLKKRNIRPKSVELISMLQTGNLDYAFEYLSVAVQHHLKYIILPNQINLGDPKYENFYKTAYIDVNGRKPGEKIRKFGSTIVYGITLLNQSVHKKSAIEFLKYFLSKNGGLKILNQDGQPPLKKLKAENLQYIPDQLKEYVSN
jgi:molybdate/tungstate transport system substrate-binding protein